MYIRMKWLFLHALHRFLYFWSLGVLFILCQASAACTTLFIDGYQPTMDEPGAGY